MTSERGDQEIHQLVSKYKSLSSNQGADLALDLSNALVTADRLEHSRHWGVLEDDVSLQMKASLQAWHLVQEKRDRLACFVHEDMAAVIMKIREHPEAKAQLVEKLERDFLLKSGLFFSLGAPGVSQDEVMTYLSIWAANPL